MSVTAGTAPDLGQAGSGPRLHALEGEVLELLVVAPGTSHCAGVELASGVLVRAWFHGRAAKRLRVYDVARVTLAEDTADVADPAQPEAVVLAAAPDVVGRLTGRRAEKLLRPLLHPSAAPLLGSRGPAVPLWERSADQPSIALVEPGGPVLLRREVGYLACRFAWNAAVHELPCLDRSVAAEMDRGGLAHRVVSLNPPIDGHCPKVVEAVLPHL
jgi:hypothetical protein